MKSSEDLIVNGFFTYVNADAQGHSLPHGIIIEPETSEDKELQNKCEDFHLNKMDIVNYAQLFDLLFHKLDI